MFLLKPRRVCVPKKVIKTLNAGDSNSPTNITVEFPSPSQGDAELVSFLKSARTGMSSMYARLRLMEGVFPVAVELENYELTGLSYKRLTGGWAVTNITFEFVTRHIRQYVIS